MSSESKEKKFGSIDDAATVIEPRSPPATQAGSPDALDRATKKLPHFDAPPHAGRALEKQEVPAIPKDERTAPRIGEYALIARFPSSASAEVFLGYKLSTFGFIRRAVVKWTDRERSDYEIVRQLLLDEGRAISFVDHPNIVTVLDLADCRSGTYLALEYVSGTDLRRVFSGLQKRGLRLPIEHVAYLARELLHGLDHAHRALGPDGQPLEIVHRDVNPSNVLISTDGHIKLTDFGAVLMQGRMQSATAPGIVKGKIRYLAPEYISEQHCTHRVDVYSVGVMLYELLSGELAFSREDSTTSMVMIVRDGLRLKNLRNAPEIPEALVDIVEKATHRKPKKRYASAAAMRDALENWLESRGAYVSPARFARHLEANHLLK